MMICQFLVAIIGVTVGFNKTVVNEAGETVARNIGAVNAQVRPLFLAPRFFFGCGLLTFYSLNRSPSLPSSSSSLLRPGAFSPGHLLESWRCADALLSVSSRGPGAWVLIGEIFPLPIRSRGVALSTASNWLWNTIIAVITPEMVGTGASCSLRVNRTYDELFTDSPAQTDKGNMKSSVFFVWGGLCTCAFVYAYFLVPETKGLSLEQVDLMFGESDPRVLVRSPRAVLLTPPALLLLLTAEVTPRTVSYTHLTLPTIYSV